MAVTHIDQQRRLFAFEVVADPKQAVPDPGSDGVVADPFARSGWSRPSAKILTATRVPPASGVRRIDAKQRPTSVAASRISVLARKVV
jgi:hypothetical protein